MRTKQLHPPEAGELFGFLGPLRADAEALTRRASRAASGFDFVNRKIWWRAYQPSRVSGGCAIGGMVML